MDKGTFYGGGRSSALYWNPLNEASLLQMLDFSVDATEKLLNDVSGKGHHAQLVNSGCISNDSGIVLTPISTTPVADGDDLKSFSCEFNIVRTVEGTFNSIIGRSIPGGYPSFLSVLLSNGYSLEYYTADGTSYNVYTVFTFTQNVEYNCKVSVNGVTGKLNATFNGTPIAEISIASLTPTTAKVGDSFRIGANAAAYPCRGKIGGVKYYRNANYTNMTHYYPMAEGMGTDVYDVVGTVNLTLTGETNRSAYSLYHYNLIKGFELYGDSGASSKLIRVPYKTDGSKITPAIAGYTKFSDCPAGAFHNFAETGIKRNYLNDATLAAAGVASTNVIYYGALSGYSGKAYCKNYMGEETDYCLFSSVIARKSYFKYKANADYIDDTVARVYVAGLTGKIHSTSLKNLIDSGTAYYFIRDGVYNLTTALTLTIKLGVGAGVVGESKTGTIVNGELPANSGNTVINVTDVFDLKSAVSSVGCRLANLSVTAKNMRYPIHDDSDVNDLIVKIQNVSSIHLGNTAAIALDALVVKVEDAYGGGFGSGWNFDAEDSYFEGFGIDNGQGRGWATHANEVGANPADFYFKNCTFKSNGGASSFRIAFNPATNKLDKWSFEDCDFSSQSIYLDAINTYSVLADKIQLYKKAGNTAPTLSIAGNTNQPFIGLQFEANAAGQSISAVAGVTTTLLMGNVISDTSGAKYHIRGDKNVTDNAAITGHVHLGADMLGDCSGVNKTMQVIVNVTTYTITFDANYTGQTNAQVVAAINVKLAALSCDATCKLYDYLTNAAFRDL